jgi:hypothetical protein
MNIFEILTESVPTRIQHIEDLVLTNGYSGAIQGISALENVIKTNAKSATIKWDGTPGIIWGRDSSGNFILTDKSGFSAKTYDGKFKNIKELETSISNRKGGGREKLIGVYKKIWPILEKSIPENFVGFIQGDLLYTSVPKIVNDFYVFTPNIVTYKISVDSDIGQKIKKSKIGVAIHSYIKDENSFPEPISRNFILNTTPDLAVFTPWLESRNKLSFDLSKIDTVKKEILNQKYVLSKTLDPVILKSAGIYDFSEILKKYINSKVRTGNLSNYVKDFPKWLKTDNMSEPKKARCLDYFNKNIINFNIIFNIFDKIMRLKNEIIKSLDSSSQEIQAYIGETPGGEGYVISNNKTPIKLVNRDIFSKVLFGSH